MLLHAVLYKPDSILVCSLNQHVLIAEHLAHVLVGPHQASTLALDSLRSGRTTAGIQQRVCRLPCLPVPSQLISAMAWEYSYGHTLGTSFIPVPHGS